MGIVVIVVPETDMVIESFGLERWAWFKGELANFLAQQWQNVSASRRNWPAGATTRTVNVEKHGSQ